MSNPLQFAKVSREKVFEGAMVISFLIEEIPGECSLFDFAAPNSIRKKMKRGEAARSKYGDSD